MTKLVILTPKERQRFDSPPIFNVNERALHFSLSNDELKLIQELRTSINKIGFIIRLGYFKANAQFYSVDNFRRIDQLLTNNVNTTDRNQMIEAINKGSVISLQHINLQDDFTKHNSNDIRFDIDKILSLKVA